MTVRLVGTALLMAALWLLMSGIYKPLVIGLGAISVATAVYVARRTDAIDGMRVDIELKPFATLRYFAWLLVEIAKANWAVTKIIASPSMPMRQHLFCVPYSQRTDLAQVMFANSITLTPGTITVEIEDDEFYVHALDYDDSVPGALAEMDRQVSTTEKDA